jgi:hypothetical protein
VNFGTPNLRIKHSIVDYLYLVLFELEHHLVVQYCLREQGKVAIYAGVDLKTNKDEYLFM